MNVTPLGIEVPMPRLFTKMATASWPPLEHQDTFPDLPRISKVRIRFDGVLKHDLVKESWSVPIDPSIDTMAVAVEDDWIELTALTRNPDAALPTCPSLVVLTNMHPGWAIGRPLTGSTY